VAIPFLQLAVELIEQIASWNDHNLLLPWDYGRILAQMSPSPDTVYLLRDTQFSCLETHFPSELIRLLLGPDSKFMDMLFSLLFNSYITVSNFFLGRIC